MHLYLFLLFDQFSVNLSSYVFYFFSSVCSNLLLKNPIVIFFISFAIVFYFSRILLWFLFAKFRSLLWINYLMRQFSFGFFHCICFSLAFEQTSKIIDLKSCSASLMLVLPQIISINCFIFLHVCHGLLFFTFFTSFVENWTFWKLYYRILDKKILRHLQGMFSNFIELICNVCIIGCMRPFKSLFL